MNVKTLLTLEGHEAVAELCGGALCGTMRLRTGDCNALATRVLNASVERVSASGNTLTLRLSEQEDTVGAVPTVKELLSAMYPTDTVRMTIVGLHASSDMELAAGDYTQLADSFQSSMVLCMSARNNTLGIAIKITPAPEGAEVQDK